MTNFTKLQHCRLGGTSNLVQVLQLGEQHLTGVFPKSIEANITKGPLDLVWSPDTGLLQLGHTYDAQEMYGDTYGYRSGLNNSMVQHLKQKAGYVERLLNLNPGDVVLDIGSNDGTLLNAYSTTGLQRIGIDPSAEKFRRFYDSSTALVSDFFSADNYRSVASKGAKVVTSIAMFYDLDDPLSFAKQVEEILDKDGVWHFEQSYMPSMLRLNSYDTICHEHLEYYSLGVVNRILGQAGLKVIDVGMNSVNGGSFAVTAAKTSNKTHGINSAVIDWMLEQEERMGINTPKPYREFEDRVFRHREDLTRLIRSLNADGKKILGYGASTKGNVVLQFCGFTAQDILAIAEVNEDKFGSYTPGSNIPIVSEAEAKRMEPDYFLVLPWHFKNGIVTREAEYLSAGGKMIFPFPEIEIV